MDKHSATHHPHKQESFFSADTAEARPARKDFYTWCPRPRSWHLRGNKSLLLLFFRKEDSFLP
jgi:hypothetical protein